MLSPSDNLKSLLRPLRGITVKALFVLLSVITITCYGNEHVCPAEQLETEISNAITEGLQVSYGDELDFSALKCGLTSSEWVKSSVSGMYCRGSNILILRRNSDDLASTKYHELQHYKNNFQLPLVNGKHPFDVIDNLFNELEEKSISTENLTLAVRIVLMILWDETLGYQLDIACSNERRFSYSDDVIIYVLKESYVPRFGGLKINEDQLRTIYFVAQNAKNLNEFESDISLNIVRKQIIESNAALVSAPQQL